MLSLYIIKPRLYITKRVKLNWGSQRAIMRSPRTFRRVYPASLTIFCRTTCVGRGSRLVGREYLNLSANITSYFADWQCHILGSCLRDELSKFVQATRSVLISRIFVLIKVPFFPPPYCLLVCQSVIFEKKKKNRQIFRIFGHIIIIECDSEHELSSVWIRLARISSWEFHAWIETFGRRRNVASQFLLSLRDWKLCQDIRHGGGSLIALPLIQFSV